MVNQRWYDNNRVFLYLVWQSLIRFENKCVKWYQEFVINWDPHRWSAISYLNIKVHVYQGGEFFWIINIIPLLILLKLLRVKFKLFLLAIDRLLQFVLIWPCSSYSSLFLIPKCVIVCDKFICLLFLLLPFWRFNNILNNDEKRWQAMI